MRVISQSKIASGMIAGIALLIMLGWLFLFVHGVRAAINTQIPFTGTLETSTGTAVADGNYSIKFVIYDSATAGTCLWTAAGTCGTPTALTVAVTNGKFQLNLGGTGQTALTGLDFNSATLYLGITVEANAEMTPRHRLGASPYAFNADTIDGLSATAVATAGELLALDGSGDFILGVGDLSATDLTLAGVAIFNGNVTIGNTAVDTLTINSILLGASPLVFEGLTANDFETTFAITDPTADRTITFQNASGTVAFTSDITGATQLSELTDVNSSTDTAGNVLVADGSGFDSVAVSGDATLASTGSLSIGADKITEAMLKAVDAAADEECLTYEATVGDFEWQSCGTSGATTALDNLAAVAINTSLLSDTTNTDSLGSDALNWANLFLGGTVVFEGATDNGFETTLTVADPGADVTITLPATTGTVITTGDTGTVTGTMIAANTVDISDDTNLTAGTNITLTDDDLSVDDAFLLNTGDTGTGNYDFSGAVMLAASPLVFEGLTANNFETTFAITDPTADRTITFQNASGTVAFTSDITGATQLSELTDVNSSTDTAGNVLVADGSGFDSVAVSGDATLASTGSLSIGADKITEAMLKAVDAAADEECLTYEATVGDFEWQSCGTGLWEDGTNGVFEDDKGVIVGIDQAETLSNTGFTLAAGDLFVQDQLGVEGNVYTDGSFIAGATTTYGDGTLTGSADYNIDFIGNDVAVQDRMVIDIDDAEAFLIRANGDANDVFTVDTTNRVAAVNAAIATTAGLAVSHPSTTGGATGIRGASIESAISSGTQSNVLIGTQTSASLLGTAVSSNQVVGSISEFIHSSGGTASFGIGAFGGVIAEDVATFGTISSAYGVAGSVEISASVSAGGTITEGSALRAFSAVNDGTGTTITTNYGVYVEDQTAGTSDYGVYIAGSDTYALWVDADDARFDDGVILGDNAADVLTANGTWSGASPFIFEGATPNDFETTFAISDPTADNTITFQDGTGTVAFTSDITGSGWTDGGTVVTLTTITDKVGIGTATPLTMLDLNGNFRATGKATAVLTGSIDPAASTTVTGVGTAFTAELVIGDRITVTGETRTVTAIASDTSLTVDTAFSNNADDTSPDALYALMTVLDSSDVMKFLINDVGNVNIGVIGDKDAQLAVQSDTSTKKSLRVIGASGQADDFLTVEQSSGTDIFSVDSLGTLDLKTIGNSHAFLIDGGNVTSAGLLRLKSYDRTNSAATDAGIFIIDSNATSITGDLTGQYIDFDTIPTANAVDRTITGLAIEMADGDQTDLSSHTTIGVDLLGEPDIGIRIGTTTAPLVFEGVTANDFETTFTMTDPTADRIITFQDGTGTVAFTSDITGSGWTDGGTDVTLTTSTDNVGIGGASLGKLSVDGDTDEIQFLVQETAGQTADIFIVEQSDGTDLFQITADGNIEIIQAAQSAGNPVALEITPGAHTTLPASTEVNDVLFGLDRTVQFNTGNFYHQRAVLMNQPTYAFVGASTISSAATLSILGAPLEGANATLDASMALLLGDEENGNNYSEDDVELQYIVLPGIEDGVGAVSFRGGLAIAGPEGNIHVGNQTATLNSYFPLSVSPGFLESTTNTRTITDAATVLIEGPPEGTNVSFTNGPYSFWVDDGISRFDGNILMSGATSGAFTLAVPATITDYTVTWPSAQASGAQFLRNDGAGSLSWATVSGTGDVVGPGSATDNAIARFDSTTGKLIQDTNEVTIDDNGNIAIVQTASTSGSPTGLLFTGGAHTTLAADTPAPFVQFDLVKNVEFSTGAFNTGIQSGIEINANTIYDFVGASNMDAAIGMSIRGMPQQGTNNTLGASVQLYVGDNSGTMAGSADLNATIAVDPPSISNGIGSISTVAGLMFFDDTLTMGNQTATLTDFNVLRVGQQTLNSTTNVRTVTNPASVYIQGAPVASTNVTFTNSPYALWVDDGESRFDGAININAGKLTVTSGGVIAVNLNATATTNGLCHSGANVDAATDTTRDIVPCSASPGDLAEWYETEVGVGAGDVVALSEQEFVYQSPSVNSFTGQLTSVTESRTLKVLSKATDQSGAVFGVVSTSPNQVIGAAVKDQAAYPQPIALLGRTPVKVSTEGGAIVAGDYLTASSTAGVARKAEAGEPIIGRAIQDYNGEGVGLVLIDVTRVSQYDGESLLASAGLLVADTEIVVERRLVFNQDMVGRAMIKKNDKEVSVTFAEPYTYQPIVTVTPSGDDALSYDLRYAVVEETTSGFVIKMNVKRNKDLIFNWHALAVDGGKLFVSDGTVEDIEIMLASE